jgi:hypothetical protein
VVAQFHAVEILTRLAHFDILSVTLVIVLSGTVAAVRKSSSAGLSSAERFNARIMPFCFTLRNHRVAYGVTFHWSF